MTFFTRYGGIAALSLASALVQAQSEPVDAGPAELAQSLFQITHNAIRATQDRPAAPDPIKAFMAATGDKTVVSGNFAQMVPAVFKHIPSVRDSRMPESLSACYAMTAPDLSVPDQTRKISTCAGQLRRQHGIGYLDGVDMAAVERIDAQATAIKASWQLTERRFD